MALTAEPDTMIVGPLRWHVALLDSAGAPVEGAAIEVRGDMNHAGMMPVISTATNEGDGVYFADFEWTMAGDWIVTVTATLADGRVKSMAYDFTVDAQ